MDSNKFFNKVLNTSAGSIDKKIPLTVINNEMIVKSEEKGAKRVRHPNLWARNVKKIKKNSVCI